MKNIRHLFTTLCFLSLCSCEDDSLVPDPDQNSNIQYVRISSSIRNFMFLPGSYWVYSNDSTGVLDSIIVESINYRWFSSGGDHGSIMTVYQDTAIVYRRSFDGDGYNHYFNKSEIYWNEEVSGGFPTSGHVFIKPNQAPDTFPTTAPGTRLIAMYNYLTLNDNTFFKVKHLRINPYLLWNQSVSLDHSRELYLNETIGIVK